MESAGNEYEHSSVFRNEESELILHRIECKDVQTNLGQFKISEHDFDIYHQDHLRGLSHSGNHRVPEISPANSSENLNEGYADSRGSSHYPQPWPSYEHSFQNFPVNQEPGYGAPSSPDGRRISTWSPQTKNGVVSPHSVITLPNDSPHIFHRRIISGGTYPVQLNMPCAPPHAPRFSAPYGPQSTPCSPPQPSYAVGWTQPMYTPPPYGMYPSPYQPIPQGHVTFGSPSQVGRQGSIVSRPASGVTEPFPDKLYRLIEDAQAEGKSDIISFFSHGRAFAIHDPDRFREEIMPRFFRQTKLASFQRQLNLYGFRRITRGPDSGGYYHAMFVRSRPDLCSYMRRTKVRGQHGGTLNRDDPNFYAMNPVDETYHPSYGTITPHGPSMPAYHPHYPTPSLQYVPV